MMRHFLKILHAMERRFYPKDLEDAQLFKQRYKAHRIFFLGLIAIFLSPLLGGIYLLLGLGLRALPFLAIFLISIVFILTYKYRWSHEIFAYGVPLATFVTLLGSVHFTDTYFWPFGMIYVPTLSYILGKRLISLFYLVAIGALFFFLSLPSWPNNLIHGIALHFGDTPNRLALTFDVTMIVIFSIIFTLDIAAEYGFHLLQVEFAKRQKLTKDLSEANQTKNQLLSVLGHDLVSPINQIKMLLEMGRLKGSCEDDDTLKLADESADRAITLMRNLTEWARAQWEGLAPKPVKVYPRILADQIAGTFRLPFLEKGVDLKNTIDTSLEVETDIDLITTILRNLVTNALKFTHTGGSVTFTNSCGPGWVELAVEDTGVGIPHEKLDKLFTADHSKVRRGTRKEIGSGLGLLICSDFAKRLGGVLKVESELNSGSRFILQLPLKFQPLPNV